jgi:subtilisin family serine protease
MARKMLWATVALWSAGAAFGQLLPQVQLPLPRVALPAVALPIDAGATLSAARALRVRELLRQNSRQLDRDPRGAPILRGVFLALSPSDAALEAARGAGFQVQRVQVLEGLDARVVTLIAPGGWSARRGLNRLRQLDPPGRYDFNHLYFETATEPGAQSASLPAPGPVIPGQAQRDAARVKLGLIDGGVAVMHPAFGGSTLVASGCDGARIDSAHGTAVASLLMGRDGSFHGAAPGMDLYSADVYCGTPLGGLVDAVVESLAWLMRQGVQVINISLVGPPNRVLEGVVRNVLARGVAIVAAVGNDGPAAKPLYPASYAGVIGVTAVDARDKLLLEAGRGPQVYFAAPGADIVAATPGGGYAAVRGTSFAAPLVAGLLASHLAAHPGESVATGLQALTATAHDLGPGGVDRSFGHGLVGAELRPYLMFGRAGQNK